MIKIVIDANIFVSALLIPGSKPAQVLNLVRARKVELLISKNILSEIERVLRYPKIVNRHQRSSEELKAFIRDTTQFATLTPGRRVIKAVTVDPDDDHCLECALEGKADYIVTGDRHLKEMKAFRGVTIVDPATFLIILAELQYHVTCLSGSIKSS